MLTESTYRVLLGALLVGFAPLGVRFRLRAARGGPVSRRGEGPVILYGLRGCGLVLWLAVLTWLIDPAALRWAALGLPDGARLAGLLLGLIGAGWTTWTFATLGPNLTDTVAVRESAYLVTTGPYRWVRHPFYVGVALLMTATTLLTDSALVGFLSAAVLTFLAARTPIEEQRLHARFGDGYRAYAARTGRFWPRLVPPGAAAHGR
jgi:protein-S-isoprenylcysteine O-methyltransferase Ste14